MVKQINFLEKPIGKSVLVVGDLMLDEYIFGSVERISPEAPVPVLKKEKTTFSLGGAANVAKNCSKLGFNVALAGILNAYDSAGKKFLEILEQEKISEDFIVFSEDRPTTVKTRIISGTHQCLRVDQEKNCEKLYQEQEDLFQKISEAIERAEIILISDYAKGVIDEKTIKFVLEKSKDLNRTIIVDPKGPKFEKYHGVDYLKPNHKEFLQMAKAFGLAQENSIATNSRKIIENLGLKGLIVTVGANGMWFISKNETIFSAGIQREVFDLSGAGDTVLAFLAFAIANHITMDESLSLANRAASIAVSKPTTCAIGIDELILEISGNKKIFYDWKELKTKLVDLQTSGKKIVITNGCFDILHNGHIHLLREAKKQGYALVVAVNSDASVKLQGKGPDRPINTLSERMEVIASLESVNFVTCFDEVMPHKIIEFLNPDILVKGSDYTKEKVVGYDHVTAKGGYVHIVDLVPGKSTTKTLQKVVIAKAEI
jgi:D-beta-D-heptose 7-phosphate kinase / D-beta-D-heptose 1-phosphate adenosyltransferase